MCTLPTPCQNHSYALRLADAIACVCLVPELRTHVCSHTPTNLSVHTLAWLDSYLSPCLTYQLRRSTTVCVGAGDDERVGCDDGCGGWHGRASCGLRVFRVEHSTRGGDALSDALGSRGFVLVFDCGVVQHTGTFVGGSSCLTYIQFVYHIPLN